MLGTLRLALALLVALSHAGLRPAGVNPGVMAVIGFYLISGYVMTGLIRRHYHQPSHARAFYFDRSLRLLPQYGLYLVLTLGWHSYNPGASYFLSSTPTTTDLFNNLLIVPLNYFMWNGSDHFTLIPPAWSLGAEIQFYLLAPFLLIWPRRLLLAGLLSLSIYLAALGGLLNSDWYGYRLLPGTLQFFLLGAYIQQCHHQKNERVHIVVALTVLVVMLTLFVLAHQGNLHKPYNLETLLGLAIGVVLLQALANRPRTRWDNLAGDIS